MMVSSTEATIEFACAKATIKERLVMDSAGKFIAHGTYSPVGPGPTLEGEPPKATFSGQVSGDKLTLRVTLENTTTPVVELTFEKGKTYSLKRCR